MQDKRRPYSSPDAAREHLVDAGLAVIQRDGLRALGISSVAKEAGVSRPTVYRYFTDLNDLVEATLVEAGDVFAARGAAFLEQFDTPAEMAVEGVIHGGQALLEDPVLGRVFGRGQVDTLALVSMRSPAGLAVAHKAWAPLVRATRWDERAARDGVRVLNQYQIMHVLVPEPDETPDQTRRFLEAHLLPAIGLTRR